MFTRKDYFKDCSIDAHQRYYKEIIEEIGQEIRLPYTLDKIKKALDNGDFYLNTLSLRGWDAYVSLIPSRVKEILKERGDCLTLGTGVCILKEYARMKCEKEFNK